MGLSNSDKNAEPWDMPGWCACCAKANMVSQDHLNPFNDAIDGNHRRRLAILKLKCMQNTP